MSLKQTKNIACADIKHGNVAIKFGKYFKENS
jgi:hypothetical protein